MAKIVFLSLKEEVPATGYWDHTFLLEMLEGIPDTDRTVVIIPGAYQGDIIPEINKELAKYPKVMVFVTSDEENKFNIDALEHPDIIKYSQYGNGGNMFPLGYAPNTHEVLKEMGIKDKTFDWFFSGQVTHYRRIKLMEQLVNNCDKGIFGQTNGFAKGLKKEDYLNDMSQSKTAPCGPGPISVDSFRLYEALESGTIPIADDTSPIRSSPDHYWEKLFGDVPFPIFNDPTQIPAMMKSCVNDPDSNNRVFAWWINKKHQIKSKLMNELGLPDPEMAVVIPVSPIPSHPYTAILEETIKSIRFHTDAPIILTFDGVREEQQALVPVYREFIRRMLWKCNFEYENILPVIFPNHHHQSGMLKTVLANIDIPLLLYVEQDTPLTIDLPIEWEKLKLNIRNGISNMIRFHFESEIPEPHKYLMIGCEEDGLLKTAQWSQRPALYSTEYLRRVMNDYFSAESNTFIEDHMHSIVQEDYKIYGMAGWAKHKIHIYYPEGSIKRSYHLDGRQGAEKYDDKLIY